MKNVYSDDVWGMKLVKIIAKLIEASFAWRCYKMKYPNFRNEDDFL